MGIHSLLPSRKKMEKLVVLTILASLFCNAFAASIEITKDTEKINLHPNSKVTQENSYAFHDTMTPLQKYLNLFNRNLMIMGKMPDENGFYTIDDMKLTREQMLRYFDLIPPRSGHPDKKWPDGIDSTGWVKCFGGSADVCEN